MNRRVLWEKADPRIRCGPVHYETSRRQHV